MNFRFAELLNFFFYLSGSGRPSESSLKTILLESFCTAVSYRRRILVRCKNELDFRIFHPYAVYYATAKKDVILICGLEIDEQNGKSRPAKFKLSQISEIIDTSKSFGYDIHWRIDAFEFSNGSICVMKPAAAEAPGANTDESSGETTKSDIN